MFFVLELQPQISKVLRGFGPVIKVQNWIPALVALLAISYGYMCPPERNEFASFSLDDVNRDPLGERCQITINGRNKSVKKLPHQLRRRERGKWGDEKQKALA